MASLVENCDSALATSALTPSPARPPTPARGFADSLSGREVEVLRLVAAGLSNRAIGERLHISPNTAANHVRSILQKTASANRAEATAYAARHGLLG
jgi:DNA-binding NarL/FixJ family response regulator